MRLLLDECLSTRLTPLLARAEMDQLSQQAADLIAPSEKSATKR